MRSCCVCTETQQKYQCNSTSFAEMEHSCKMCCKKKDGTCSPFVQADGSFLFLRKGKPCTVGFCDEGVSSSSLTPASIFGICFPVLFSRHLRSLLRCNRGSAWSRCRTWSRGCGISLTSWTSIPLVSDGQTPWNETESNCFLTTNSSIREVPGWQHSGLRCGVFPHLLDSPQHPSPLCGKNCSTSICLGAKCFARSQSCFHPTHISTDQCRCEHQLLSGLESFHVIKCWNVSFLSSLLSVFRTSDLISSTRKTQSAYTSHQAWVSSLYSVAI